MATGDDAAAAGMDIINPAVTPLAQVGEEINYTRDEIARRTSAVMPISKGGTGSTTAAAARTALGVPSTSDLSSGLAGKANTSHNHSASQITSGTLSLDRIPAIPWGDVSGNPSTFPPSSHAHSSIGSGSMNFGISGTQWYTNDPVGVDNNLVVGLVLSNPYGRNTPVSTNYVSAYFNSDGRLGATPSALRFKQDITPHPYTLEQLMLMQVVTYRLKTAVEEHGDAAPYEVGVIAEQLIEAGLGEFVLYDENGHVFSVAYERLALVCIGATQELGAHVIELAATVTDMRTRLEALEAGQ